MYATECLVTTSLFDVFVHLHRACDCLQSSHCIRIIPHDVQTVILQPIYTVRFVSPCHSGYARSCPRCLLTSLSLESPRRVLHLSEEVTAGYEQAQIVESSD